MYFPKYDGKIHPDEWINDLQKYLGHKAINSNESLDIAISLVDSTISLPTGIDSFEKLRKALKETIFFTVFKNTNKRKLQSLKYIPEREGGDTIKFISNFLKLCNNAEIDDLLEQKNYLYKSLPMNHFNYISNEFLEKMKIINSINELIKEFEDIVSDESNLIRNGSIVALKDATGKYLRSNKNGGQGVIVENTVSDQNSYWKIKFGKELATYNNHNNYINLQHFNSRNTFLRIVNDYSSSRKVVCCYLPIPGSSENYWYKDRVWKFNHSKLKNHQGYLKSNDIINLSTDRDGFLRSQNDQVICHTGRLGGNDEWCIEIIRQQDIQADSKD